MTEISNYAFNGCKSLKSFSVPAKVKKIGMGAFMGCTSIKTVTIETGTSTLSLGCNRVLPQTNYTLLQATPLFEDCDIEKVTINRTISSSGCDYYGRPLGCFANTGVKSVTLSGNVKEIEGGAFFGCANITSIFIPKSVKKIYEHAFCGSGIKSITFEDGLDNLEFELTVPNWNIITPTAFSDTKIEYAYIGRNFTSSGGSQNPNYFNNPSTFLPTTLKQLIIGDYVKNIDLLLYSKQRKTTSLSHYPNLSEIEFGAGIKNIPNLSGNALLNTLATASVVPPMSESFTNSQYMNMIVEVPMGTINAYKSNDIWNKFWEMNEKDSLLRVFEVNNLLYKRVANNCLMVIANDSQYKGDIVIPEDVSYNDESFKVISIEEEVFANCKELTSVSVPQTVKNIPKYCFYGCTSLYKVQLANDIESIGDCAFYECSSLTEITWPESLTSVGQSAFFYCSGLLDFIGKNVKFIGEQAFYGCSKLKEVILNENITEIPSFCFCFCHELSTISLTSIKRIGGSAFMSCFSISKIDLPVIQYIGGCAFMYCKKLKKINLGSELEEIFTNAFADCTSLETVTIPGSVRKIWHGILAGCTSLKEIVFADGDSPLEIKAITFDTRTDVLHKQVNGKSVSFQIEYYKSDFTAPQVERIYLGRNLSDAPRHKIKYDEKKGYWEITSYDGPLNDLPKLKELIIGKNVNTLGPSRVYWPNLDLEVTPGSFKRCEALETVSVMNPIPPLGAEFSRTTYSNAWLEIPLGTQSAYQNSEGWKEFQYIDEGNSIMTQPTENKLCVELYTPDDGAKYQWYQCAETKVDSKAISPISFGTYGWLEDNGTWYSNNQHKSSSTAMMSASIDVLAGDILNFDWSVSSQSGRDYFAVTINDLQVLKKSGIQGGNYKTVFTSAATISIDFKYTKDSEYYSGSDRAVVSNISIMRPNAIEIQGATSSILDKSLVTGQCKVYCIVTLSNGRTLISDSCIVSNAVTSNPSIYSSDDYVVYNINGVTVLKGNKKSDIGKLPKGIYIVNGKKMVVK